MVVVLISYSFIAVISILYIPFHNPNEQLKPDSKLDMIIASSTDEETIEACKLLKQFRYLDDILLALDDSKQAITITKAINKIFGDMGRRAKS